MVAHHKGSRHQGGVRAELNCVPRASEASAERTRSEDPGYYDQTAKSRFQRRVRAISANYDLIRKGQQKDIPLQPYDIVEVDHSKDSFGVALGKMIIGAGKTSLTTFTSSGAIRILY